MRHVRAIMYICGVLSETATDWYLSLGLTALWVRYWGSIPNSKFASSGSAPKESDYPVNNSTACEVIFIYFISIVLLSNLSTLSLCLFSSAIIIKLEFKCRILQFNQHKEQTWQIQFDSHTYSPLLQLQPSHLTNLSESTCNPPNSILITIPRSHPLNLPHRSRNHTPKVKLQS